LIYVAADSLKDTKIPRREFLKLMGAGALFLGLGAFGISNLLKTASAINASNMSKINNLVDIPEAELVEALDKFGVLKLYPTKTGGLEWFSDKWKNGQSRTLQEGNTDPYDSRFSWSCGQPNVGFKIVGDGQAYVTSYTDSARLFVNGPWINTEMTIYMKGRNMSDIQLRSRSNHQKECGFGNYLVKYHNVNKKASVEVEPLHPIYQRHLGEVPFNGFSLDKWIGFKQITRTVENNKVKVEGYMNLSESSQNNWKKLTEYTFDGTNTNIILVDYEPYRQASIDKGDMTANDINKGCLFLPCGQHCWVRINKSNQTRLKWFSVREI
jgi:hypothetical protein